MSAEEGEEKRGDEKRTHIFDTIAKLAPVLAYNTPLIPVNTSTDTYGASLTGRMRRKTCGTTRSYASCEKSSVALRMPEILFRLRLRP
jgi:hypothetical protein